jgi:cell wall assembly regulator SMI1
MHGRHSVEPAAHGAESLTDLLHRIDQWLARHRPRFHKALLPGAKGAQCDALQAALGMPLPEELRAWQMWHNGQSADVMGAFVDSWNLMSTDEIADAKKELDAEGHAGWQRGWIPFLDDDNDNYLCLDPGQPGAAVRECWRGNPEHKVIAPALRAWVERFLQDLEGGRYYEDPERGIFLRR